MLNVFSASHGSLTLSWSRNGLFAKLLRSCCEDVGGVILFWQSTEDRRLESPHYSHAKVSNILLPKMSNTVFVTISSRK